MGRRWAFISQTPGVGSLGAGLFRGLADFLARFAEEGLRAALKANLGPEAPKLLTRGARRASSANVEPEKSWPSLL